LYITTARINTGEEELEKYPNAGGVFKVKPGVKGVEANFFIDQ
jgi:sugar lactone lactonase YvrE